MLIWDDTEGGEMGGERGVPSWTAKWRRILSPLTRDSWRRPPIDMLDFDVLQLPESKWGQEVG